MNFVEQFFNSSQRCFTHIQVLICHKNQKFLMKPGDKSKL